MRTWMLQRHKDTELIFEGDHLVTVDDREWLGVTPNWWELSLYRTAHNTYILGSIYHQNYPRGGTIYGALAMPHLEEVSHCLLQRCAAPQMIIDALLVRARRRIHFLDTTMHKAPFRLTRPAFGLDKAARCAVPA